MCSYVLVCVCVCVCVCVSISLSCLQAEVSDRGALFLSVSLSLPPHVGLVVSWDTHIHTANSQWGKSTHTVAHIDTYTIYCTNNIHGFIHTQKQTHSATHSADTHTRTHIQSISNNVWCVSSHTHTYVHILASTNSHKGYFILHLSSLSPSNTS